GATLEVAPLRGRAQRLDLVLREGCRAGVDHLHPVVLDRVVTSGNVGAAVELPVGGREVEDRRGRETDVDHADAGGPRAGDEPALELAGGDAVVLADGDAAAADTADEGCVGAGHPAVGSGRDVPTPTH